MERATPLQFALHKGHWFKIIRFTGKCNISAFCNAARQFLNRYSDDGLGFEYLWFRVANDVTYLVVTGTRTSLTVLASYLDGHTHHVEHAVTVREGRGAKAFESIVTDLYARRVPVAGKHTQGRSIQ